MRVAIACCGLEHVHRGFEAFSRELFTALTGRTDVILFKGSGKSLPNEIVVPCLRRDFLMRFMNPLRAFYWEQITFTIALIPYLILNNVLLLAFLLQSRNRLKMSLVLYSLNFALKFAS